MPLYQQNRQVPGDCRQEEKTMRFRHLLLVTAVAFFNFFVMWGQQEHFVSQKPGKFAKQYGKNPTAITDLKVTGPLNAKDVIVLCAMKNLVKLDLSDSQLDCTLKLDGTMPLKDLRLPHDKGFELIDIFGKGFTLDTFYGDRIGFLAYGHSIESIRSMHVYSLMQTEITPYGGDAFQKEVYIQSEYLKNDYHAYPDGRRVKVDTLYLNELNEIGSNELTAIDPAYIVLPNYKPLLNRYTGNKKDINFDDYSYIYPYAFANTNIETVNSGSSTSVPIGCFSGCNNLKDVVLPNIEDIGPKAFEKTSLKKLVLPACLKKIDAHSVDKSQIKTIEFTSQYAPEITHIGLYSLIITNTDLSKIDCIIPDNATQKYSIGDWKYLNLTEKGVLKNNAGSKEIILDKAGTLSKYINDKNALSFTALTIKGIMDDTEMRILNKCKNLRFLDMTYCFVKKSDATLKSEAADRALVLALLSATFNNAESVTSSQINNGRGTANTVATNIEATLGKQYIDAAIKQEQKRGIVADPNCVLPHYSFDGMDKLEEIRFPIQLKTLRVNLGYRKLLRKIVLPPALVTLGDYCFQSCPRLEEVNFPPTLESIGERCFGGGIGEQDFRNSLKVVDLSMTKIKKIDRYNFLGCETIKLPGNFKEYFLCETIKNIYVYGKENTGIFDYDSYPHETVLHVFKGCKAGWTSAVRCEIIDDIDW